MKGETIMSNIDTLADYFLEVVWPEIQDAQGIPSHILPTEYDFQQWLETAQEGY